MTGPATPFDIAVMLLLEDALARPSGEREAYIAGRTDQDEAVRAEALNLCRSDAAREQALRTGAALSSLATDGEDAPPTITGYRILHEIGRGGMGSVYLAERAGRDFAHRVAIKVIKPGILSDSLADRFRRERQILATLNHPNIAHLHDGGETEDGAPYIVMEYVAGRTLRDWLAQDNPGRDERIALFYQIARAVGFAHQNLVIHRDLTPGNVLVTSDGQAKLIDFGIARPQQADDGPASQSRFSGLSLTPGFAAPERQEGLASNTLVDIYSLGKLLAFMLGDDVPPELSALARKAAAPDPSDRYSSVSDMIDDLDRYQAGKTVSAYGGTPLYRLGKFIRRERAFAALMVAILVGLGATTFAWRNAVAARAEAEQRFEDTRSIAKLMMFDAFDAVSAVPGSTNARRILAEGSQRYLDALAADRRAPDDVRLEAARGFIHLADVMGSNRSGSLGRLRENGKLLSKADELLMPLHAADGDDPELAVTFAELRTRQAFDLMYNNGKIPEGGQRAREALAIIAPHARSNADAARINILALTSLGDSYGWDGKFEEAAVPYEKAVLFAQSLPPSMRRTPAVMQASAQNLRMLAEAYHHSERDPLARKMLDGAIGINRALLALNSADPRRQRALIVVHWYRAVIDRSADLDASAAWHIDTAMQMVEELASRNAGDADSATLFSTVAEVKAQMLADTRRFAESYALSDRIIAVNRDRVAKADGASGAWRAFAEVLNTSGTNHYNGADYAGACRLWRESRDIWRMLQKRAELSEWDVESLEKATYRVANACDPPRKMAVER